MLLLQFCNQRESTSLELFSENDFEYWHQTKCLYFISPPKWALDLLIHNSVANFHRVQEILSLQRLSLWCSLELLEGILQSTGNYF